MTGCTVLELDGGLCGLGYGAWESHRSGFMGALLGEPDIWISYGQPPAELVMAS